MTLDIALIGRPVVEVDGKPLDVDTRKAVALLAYLVVEGTEQPRDRLVDLLWPDSDVDRARSSLRRTLSTLRSALDGRWMGADRAFVRLDRDGVTTDFEELERLLGETHGHDPDDICALCIAPMTAAVALHRGPFLDGFVLRDAAPFEAWVTVNAARVAHRIDTAYARLAAALAAEGRYDAAAETAAQRVELDSLREDAYRPLMLYHAWSGNRSGAVDAYRRLVSTLEIELGVPPLDETTELYEAILEEDLPRAPAAPRRIVVRDPHPSPTPLVGRDESISDVLSEVGEAGGVALVHGPPGAGVTRVLEEIAGRLGDTGEGEATVMWAAGSRATSDVAYGLIHDALFAVLERPEIRAGLDELPAGVRAEAARLFPTIASVTPPSGTDRARFLDALARVLSTMPRPTLVLDDLHLADLPSVEAVAFLAPRATEIGLAIVAGVTSTPDQATEGADRIVMELMRSQLDVEVGPLERDDIAALLEAMGASGDPQDLYERTGGVALYLVEAIRSAGEADLPLEVRRRIAARIARLEGIPRQIYEGLAVLGRSADPPLVAAVSGRTADETDEALDVLIGRGLVREQRDGWVVGAHGFLADIVLSAMSAARVRLLNRRAARALAALPTAEPARVARHHLLAGDLAEAAEAYGDAGDAAGNVLAHREAVAHYEAALAAGHPDRSLLHRAIAAAATLDGRYDRAVAAHEAALGAGDERPAEIEHALGEIHRRLMRWDLSAAHYERALGETPNSDLHVVILADLAYVEARRGNQDEARAHVTEALEMAESTGDPRSLARAHNVAGLLASDTGERVRHLRRALAHAADRHERVAILNNLAAATDSPEAIELLEEAIVVAGSIGDRHVLAALHNALADARHAAGDESGARDALARAVSEFSEITAESDDPWIPEVWLLTEW